MRKQDLIQEQVSLVRTHKTAAQVSCELTCWSLQLILSKYFRPQNL